MMKKRKMMVVVALLVTIAAHAQWRVGATTGGDYNYYSMNKQYMTDLEVEPFLGFTAGVSGQYNFTDWFGVRVDLNWTQKNYQILRAKLAEYEYFYRNDYLQLPMMATFSFGGKRLRGFCNVGYYVGYWLSSHRSGTDFNLFTDQYVNFSENVEFNKDRDHRPEFGLVGSAGLEFHMNPNWLIQFEARYYHGLTTTTEQYMRVKDYRYNSTLAFQVGVYYVFKRKSEKDDN